MVNFLYELKNSKYYIILTAAVISLCGCQHTDISSQKHNHLTTPPSFEARYDNGQLSTYSPSSIEPAGGTSLGLDRVQARASCRPQDRFDRRGALAYQFGENDRNRFALHLSMDGPGFSNPMPKVEQVMMRYTLKFQKHKNRKERCRYPSAYQGLFGSIYNELYKREGKNAFDEAMDELEHRGLDFWR